jgi:drug/metabolite transporter (DMT)-like permease
MRAAQRFDALRLTLLAPASLLLAATTWGLIWYPYRLLQAEGISGSAASLLTYLLGVIPLLFWARHAGWWVSKSQLGWLLAVALTAGWTNLSYVLAVIHGEVMRVMLLFYMAPLWTVLFAWLILRERAGPWGWAVIALALAGAAVMLYQPEMGLPLPTNAAEWLALSSGIGFALTNVLTRKARDIAIETRSLWIFIGVASVAAVFMLARGESLPDLSQISASNWWLMLGVTVALFLATFSVQYGLAHMQANRAVVILLFELVVAAAASLWLTQETISLRDWIGGLMIVAATLFSIKTNQKETK